MQSNKDTHLLYVTDWMEWSYENDPMMRYFKQNVYLEKLREFQKYIKHFKITPYYEIWNFVVKKSIHPNHIYKTTIKKIPTTTKQADKQKNFDKQIVVDMPLKNTCISIIELQLYSFSIWTYLTDFSQIPNKAYFQMLLCQIKM